MTQNVAVSTGVFKVVAYFCDEAAQKYFKKDWNFIIFKLQKKDDGYVNLAHALLLFMNDKKTFHIILR